MVAELVSQCTPRTMQPDGGIALRDTERRRELVERRPFDVGAPQDVGVR